MRAQPPPRVDRCCFGRLVCRYLQSFPPRGNNDRPRDGGCDRTPAGRAGIWSEPRAKRWLGLHLQMYSTGVGVAFSVWLGGIVRRTVVVIVSPAGEERGCGTDVPATYYLPHTAASCLYFARKRLEPPESWIILKPRR